ncbi:hypothetical protein ACFQE1_07825, partial [Halobium palmae]
MANFTLFEVHLPEGNVQFGPSGLDFARKDGDEDHLDADEGTEIDVDGDADEESGGRGLGSLLVALVVLAAVAFAASKFLG